MPIQPRSRHSRLPVIRVRDASGVEHEAVTLRPPPPPPASATRHVVSGLESLEYLAWRYLNTSDAWWQIADANPNAFPLDLQPGARVVIPSAADAGRVTRTRRF